MKKRSIRISEATHVGAEVTKLVAKLGTSVSPEAIHFLEAEVLSAAKELQAQGSRVTATNCQFDATRILKTETLEVSLVASFGPAKKSPMVWALGLVRKLLGR